MNSWPDFITILDDENLKVKIEHDYIFMLGALLGFEIVK
jgi:hypothetical protein